MSADIALALNHDYKWACKRLANAHDLLASAERTAADELPLIKSAGTTYEAAIRHNLEYRREQVALAEKYLRMTQP